MKLRITTGLLILASNSFGALVELSSLGSNYNGTDDYGVVLSSGSPITSGMGTATAGFFSTLSDTQVTQLAEAMDYATLFAPGNFTSIIGSDFSNSGFGPVDGFFQNSIAGYDPTAGLNEVLYVYFVSGTEIGLFRSTQTLVADAGGTSPENNYFIRLSDGTPLIGKAGPSYETDYSNIGGQGFENTTIANTFQLVDTVPEPSSALIAALGALSLMRRRR